MFARASVATGQLEHKVTKYKSSVREDLPTETVKRTHWSCQEQEELAFSMALCVK